MNKEQLINVILQTSKLLYDLSQKLLDIAENEVNEIETASKDMQDSDVCTSYVSRNLLNNKNAMIDFRENKSKTNAKSSEESIANPLILYITTKCNLDCVYCYERSRHGSLPDLDFEEIKQSIMSHINDCKKLNIQPIVVLFGGEPFLRKDLVINTIQFVKELRERNEDVFIGINTNGTIQLSDDELELIYMSKPFFRIEVSFDGSLQDKQRPFKNGKGSRGSVEMFIKRLEEHSIPWQLSYALTDESAEIWKNDFTDFITKYKYLEKIVLRYPWNYITSHNKIRQAEIEMRQFGIENNVPICELVCDHCNKCKKVSNAYKYFIPQKGIWVQPKVTYGEFKHF